jgi:hypothetical protein
VRPRAARGRRRRKTEAELLYLTTTGRLTGVPREIEIWFTRRAGRAYLVAETGERNLQADPRIRWRVGSRRHIGRARVVNRVREAALAAAVRSRFEAKYGWSDGLLVELRPRTRRGPAVDTGGGVISS